MLYFTNSDNDDAVIPSSRSSQRKTRNEHVFNQNNAFIKKNHLTIATIATRFLL